MAEEEKKDFSKFHSLPVSEWSSTLGGDEYIKYLRKADAKNEISKLTSEEKSDLQRLKTEKSNDAEAESEEDQTVDLSSIDWNRLKSPTSVAFYLSVPKFFLNKSDKNIKNFVEQEFESKSMLKISLEAQKKVDEQTGTAETKGDSNESSEEGKEQPEEKPKGLFQKMIIWLKPKSKAKEYSNQEHAEDYGKSVQNENNTFDKKPLEESGKEEMGHE